MIKDFIVFHNDYEKNLFDLELCGQISDGMYENSSPDWKYWCNLETRVGDKIGRTDNNYKYTCKKDNYAFSGLYDIIGERMEAIIKLTSVNAPKNILNNYWYYENFPAYLGEYEKDRHELIKCGKVDEILKRNLDDRELELFNWLEEEYGEEEMYNVWNRTYRPFYKEVLKGVRECMKTKLTRNDANEINEKILAEKQSKGLPLTKDEQKEELKKHLVRTVRKDGRIRVEANDGKHGRAYVSFPNKLRTTENLFYYVENGLRWNGKNYLASEKDGIREATNEEIKIMMLK